ncbi:hypothetical protein [Nonomuraea pusilla]|uniref:Uncharacterized protein n=1 Tax=Nonomuraea pusilla TaxID=46177 RepID=A0A1H8K4X7_9ACTN|nr:hypothetical protein [Nonomuraea pusilla]SEN88013.1 hypothetical protein SAMN05660976_08525 [Nonomuraea pusilla]
MSAVDLSLRGLLLIGVLCFLAGTAFLGAIYLTWRREEQARECPWDIGDLFGEDGRDD